MMSLRTLALAVLAVLLLIAPARASDGSAADLLAAVNRVRSGAGLPALAVNPRLACAARRHARDIAGRGRLDHVGGDGADLATRLARVGYLYVARRKTWPLPVATSPKWWRCGRQAQGTAATCWMRP